MCRTFKNCLFMLLILSAVMTASSAAAEDSGTCGQNAAWTLTEDGLLTVSGTGTLDAAEWPDTPTIKYVMIQEGITEIGNNAFRECRKMVSVSLPDSLLSIGDSAFESCASLTSVYIPQNVTYIGKKAFQNCYYMDKIQFPDSLETIDEYAFCACAMKELSLPSALKTLGEGAFKYCSKLESAGILRGISVLAAGTFEGCTVLNQIELSEGLIQIGESAFRNCYQLRLSSIPEGVKEIEKGAFYGSGLKEVILPESLEQIGDEAFAGSVQKITVSDGLKSIGTSAIDTWRCQIVATIGTNASRTLSTAGYSFIDPSCPDVYLQYSEDGTRLMAVNAIKTIVSAAIPSAVTDIGEKAFANCSELEEVILQEGLRSIGDSAFLSCVKLNSVSLPDSVTKIGASAFASCTRLCEVYLPSGITVIENGSFFRTALTKITLPNGVTTIGDGAFGECEKLEEILLPSTVRSIGNRAFSYCKALAGITLPEGVTGIGSNAFEGCSALEEFSLPSTVTFIGADAFSGCQGLTYISIPEGVSAIEARTFWACFSLSAVRIPSTVVHIGEYALSSCVMITSVSIPEGVESIADYAFSSCSDLKKVYFPRSLQYISDTAFEKVSSMICYCYESSEAEKWALAHGFEVVLLDGETLKVTLPESMLVLVGTKAPIMESIVPRTGNEVIRWSCSDESVATVAQDGILTALGKGNVIVTLNVDGVQAQMTVQCVMPVQWIYLPNPVCVVRNTTVKVPIRVEPEDAVTELTWSIGDSLYAVVDDSGNITGALAGQTRLTVTDTLTGKTFETVVRVCYPVSAITLTPEKVSLENGSTGRISAIVETLDYTAHDSQLITFDSSDPSVAVVSGDGTVQAVGAGSTVITATADSGVSANVLVEVYANEEETTETPAARIPGDANEDGKADTSDALRILQFIKDATVPINQDNADVNGDGTVDMKDAMLVLQYASGWDVELK